MTDDDYYNRLAADLPWPPGPPPFTEHWAHSQTQPSPLPSTSQLHTPNTYRRPQDFLWLCWEWLWLFLGAVWFLMLMGYMPPPWKWFK